MPEVKPGLGTNRSVIVLSISIILSFASLKPGNAQPLPVGDLREEQLRIMQLMNDSLHTSFTNRPVWKQTYDSYTDNETGGTSWWNRRNDYLEVVQNEFMQVGLYEPVFGNTYNTRLPIGENNGAAWYGKGLTSELQGGFYATSEYVTLTFRPHISYQQNRHFEVPRFVPRDSLDNVLYGADELGFGIDNPFRFGPDPYWTFDFGHSSLRLHYKGIEAGIGSEPLWWGPAVRYPLMMSNNAPGLKQIFLGTREPLHLPLNIGNLEFRWIWGWPEDSDYFPEINPVEINERLEGFTNRRFMNGLNLVFTPSILPNLHLGLTRVFHQFIPENGLSATDFFDIFQAFQKDKRAEVIGNFGDDLKNQLASVYLRWVWPEGNSEIYLEYFKEDHNKNLRDFLMEPEHDRAYTIGLQKLIRGSGNFIDFYKVNAEINSLEPTRLDEQRYQAYYYTHSQIRQGHTNRGQILGAALGPGSSSQYLGVDAYASKGKAGLFIQRYVDNNFFHYEFNDQQPFGEGRGDFWRHRVNLNIGTNLLYKLDHLIFNGRFIWTKAYNYGRFGYGSDSPPDAPGNDGYHDVVNLQFQLSVRYLLK